MKEIIIDSNNHNQRFDRFLRKYFRQQDGISLADIYRGIRNREILVNEKKSKEDYRLNDGDQILIKDEFFKNKTITKKKKQENLVKISTEEIKKTIIFEDKNRLVFDKPTGNKEQNMHEILRKYVGTSGSTFDAAFGYRLDKETSGVLIAGKTYDSLQYINKIIREREISKEYLAIVLGKFPKKLEMNQPLKRVFSGKFQRWKTMIAEKTDSEAKEAKSIAWLEKSIKNPNFGEISLIKIQIETGRMHQIRVHLANEWFPILWDILYGQPRANRVLFEKLKLKKLFLHCWKYEFWDVFLEKNIKFEAKIPIHFDLILKK